MSLTYASVVADTVHPECAGARIITVEYQAPRFLLAEINTHGVFAKSAASSRAIPVERRITFVEDSPFVPIAFGKNARGMQARENISGPGAAECYAVWKDARDDAVRHAKRLADLGVHKQHANRILEPFAYVRGVITATEWDNFFKLRLSPEAQPEFEELARNIQSHISSSTPSEGRFHLPYVLPEELPQLAMEERIMVSAARCARVSYKLFDGSTSPLAKDLELCGKLFEEGHMSPFDHPAIGDDIEYNETQTSARWANPSHHGRFWGWVAVRRELEKQLGRASRRDSYAVMSLED